MHDPLARPFAALFAVVGLATVGAALADERPLEAFLESHCPGGLVVQLGAENLDDARRLGSTGRYLVQVLDRDAARVETARETLQEAGLYGLVTVDRHSATTLPYAENLVNVLIMGGRPVPAAEVDRVLCPNGWLVGNSAQVDKDLCTHAGLGAPAPIAGLGWNAAQKPWPAAMDQWPQPKHGADGNAVSRDSAVGPPRRIRWVAGPQQEISNMVSAGGRNFYGGVLTRDAFNGLLLWQQKLSPSPARGGFGYGGRAPRPVALGDGLLAMTGRLSLLDGGTGALRREYPEAGEPSEVLVDGGLILAVNKGSLRAVDAESGRLRWAHLAVEPRSVVAADGAVYFIQGDARRGGVVSLVRLDQASGKPAWTRSYDWIPAVKQCVIHGERLVCEISTVADEKKGNRIEVLSASSGEPLWNFVFVPGSAHMKQARAMFVGNALWVLSESGWVELDPVRGTQRRKLPGGWGHCFPPVATSRFLIHGEMHLTSLENGLLDANPITKGNCSRDVGFMPANGLIYTTPKHCICWPMLRDYTALAPKRPQNVALAGEAEFRLESAPAASGTSSPSQQDRPAEGWPCYRYDAWRSAATPARVPTALHVAWSTPLGDWPKGTIAEDWRTNAYVRGPVTPPVVAAGMVCVARPDAQQVVALDADSGQIRWRRTVDGRVDTPPTIHAGLCLFGTRSGTVYALRTDDGGEVWRLRVGPCDERIVTYGQVESPWPVAGSVLVLQGRAYFAAGRQPLADGGVGVFAVEPTTGKVLWHQRIDEVPQQSDRVAHPFYNSTGLEFDNFDLMHREGDGVAMSRWLFEPATGKTTCDRYNGFVRVGQAPGGVWMPRGCWSYAPRNESEQRKERPFLRPLACAEGNRLYSLTEDRQGLFRRDFDLSGGEAFDTKWFAGWKTYEEARKGGDLWRSQRLARKAKWTVNPFDKTPANAMLLAGNALVLGAADGRLAVLSREDGSVLGRAETSPIVWDGLAATEGRLFATTRDGSLICLSRP